MQTTSKVDGRSPLNAPLHSVTLRVEQGRRRAQCICLGEAGPAAAWARKALSLARIHVSLWDVELDVDDVQPKEPSRTGSAAGDHHSFSDR